MVSREGVPILRVITVDLNRCAEKKREVRRVIYLVKNVD